MHDPKSERLVAKAAVLLFENGQTTEGTRLAVQALSEARSNGFELLASWGQLTVLVPGNGAAVQVRATPLAVDIGRVMAAERIIDQVCGGRIDTDRALASLHEVGARPAVSLQRLACMAATGAAGLGVIFGAADALTLILIAASAGIGACVRRGAALLSDNAFLQPFVAALLAGLLAAGSVALALPTSDRLVAVCPCMVLVPGPHVLNGAIDLFRARIPLGAARLTFAGLVILAICTGLLTGLSAEGGTLAAAGPAPIVPLAYDVCAAGLAVAAYGSFFNMPWRMLPIPIGIGMLAHAFRWVLLAAGFSIEAGAFAACLLVGSIVSPLAHWFRIPFGAMAFASVVSLIPGVYLFQAASQAMALINASGGGVSNMSGLVENGITAFLVIAAMTAGLIIPKIFTDHVLTWYEKKRL